MNRVELVACVVAIASGMAWGQNVALNKPVTVVSGAGSLLTPVPSPSVVTDGVFLNEATSYSHPSALSGSLRWNTGLAGSTTLEIQLGGLYMIDGIIVQADDNDALLVSYLDANNNYQTLYSVTLLSVGFGFRTRPFADQTIYATLAPVTTSAIRIVNNGGDGFYGISELQLRGVPAISCDSIDFNNDTSVFDPVDIDAFLSVYGEGPCIPETATCNDIDFNNDGSLFDPCDIDSFLLQFSEGPCTPCGV